MFFKLMLPKIFFHVATDFFSCSIRFFRRTIRDLFTDNENPYKKTRHIITFTALRPETL
jgi:hypothetical protein